MARLIEEEIIAEDAETLTIRFKRRSGRYLDRTIKKIEGITNEQLLTKYHRLVTLEYLQNRILPNKWIKPEEQTQE